MRKIIDLRAKLVTLLQENIKKHFMTLQDAVISQDTKSTTMKEKNSINCIISIYLPRYHLKS